MLRTNFKTRNFLFELYPDNSKHVAAFDYITGGKIVKPHDWVYILHHITDLDENLINDGEGKPHYHLVLTFPGPVYASALAKRLGLVTDLGEPDYQFIQQIHNLDDSLLYLTHVKYPDKEQYSFYDIKGSQKLLRQYESAYFSWIERKKVTVREALWAFRDWVEHQTGVITAEKVVRWIVKTPYIRFRNEKLFHQMIADHNAKEYRHTDILDEYARGCIELNRRQRMISGSDIQALELSDSDYDQLCKDIIRSEYSD